MSTSIVGTVSNETDCRCRNAQDNALPTVVLMSTVGMGPTETDGRCRYELNNALPTVLPESIFGIWYRPRPTVGFGMH